MSDILNPFCIMRDVEQYFHLPFGSMVGRNARKTTAAARSVAMYLVRVTNKMSYPEIGEYFDRDHKAVILNCKKIAKLMEGDRQDYVSRATIHLMHKFKESV